MMSNFQKLKQTVGIASLSGIIWFTSCYFLAKHIVFHKPENVSMTKQQVFIDPTEDVATKSSPPDLSYPWLSILNSHKCKENEEWSMTFRYLDVKLICKRNTEPCYVWHWDVANWTLIYSNNTMDVDASKPTRFCPVAIHGERTARIINPGGSIQYPGCTMKKYPCSSSMDLLYASFDKKLKMRINRSPCCRKQLIDITHHMGRVFDEYNVTYFLTGGAVISLVRDNGELIPYDVDTDVSVDGNDKDKVIKALPLLRKPGYIFKWSEYGHETYMVGCTNEHCLNGPGISFYTIKEGIVKALTKKVQNVPADIAIPPVRGKFEGLEMSFPKDPVKYLDYIYGKEKWKTPLRCTEHYYGQCTA